MSSSPLSIIHARLMSNLTQLDNMLQGDENDDPEVLNDLEGMCEELGVLEEVMFLKSHVDCDCFYNPNHEGYCK